MIVGGVHPRAAESLLRRTQHPADGAPLRLRGLRRALVGGTVLVVAVVVGVSGCATAIPATPPGTGSVGAPDASPAIPVTPSPSSPPEAAAVPPPPSSAQAAPLAQGLPPASVAIPAIDLDEPLIDLGLQTDGSMEVPVDFADVGWFTGGGRPGGVGPTVIAGHVDSSVGPAVFFRLRDLVPGDTVVVTDTAGASFTYVVDRVGDYPKADFPTSEVFGAIPRDELRLITCTGLFDTSVGHYEDNRVVFASRTP